MSAIPLPPDNPSVVAQGFGATAVGGRGVNVGGSVQAPIVTGDNAVLFGADFTAGLQNQAVQQALQELFRQALAGTVRPPSLAELFTIVRDPAAVPAAVFGGDYGREPLRPDEVPYQTDAGHVAALPAPQAAQSLKCLLLVGRGGLGRTREAARLAQELCRAGWTVCVARPESRRRMGAPADDLADRRVLVVVDDLHRHGAGPGGLDDYLERLSLCLEQLSADPGLRLAVLLTAPAGVVAGHPLWQSCRPAELGEFDLDALERLLQEVAAIAGPALPVAARSLAENSDRTPKTIVANVNRALREQRPLSAETWENTAEGAWAAAFRLAYDDLPETAGVYRALHLLDAADLPGRTVYVQALAGLTDAETTAALRRLLQQGLIRLEAGVAYRLAAGQLTEGLSAAGLPRPALPDEWLAVSDALVAAGAPLNQPDDMLALSAALEELQLPAAVEHVLTALLEGNPAYLPGYERRAEARFAAEDLDGAVRDLTLLIDGGRAEPDKYLLRGLALVQQLDYAQALPDLERAVTELDDALSWSALGLAYYMQMQMAEAEAAFTTALERGGREVMLFRLRGFARYAQRRFAPAVEDWTAALALEDAPDLRLQLAWVYLETADWAGAEAAFDAALETEEQRPFIVWGRGLSRLMLGKFDEAIPDLTAAVDGWEDDPLVRALPGVTRPDAPAGDDQDTEAQAQQVGLFRAFLAAIPAQTDDAADKLAEMPHFAGFADRWSAFMKQKLVDAGIEPGAFGRQFGAQPYLARGLAYLQSGRYAEAESDALAAQQRGAAPDEALTLLGLARLGLGRPAEAAADLQTVVDAQTNRSLPALFWLGSARYLARDAAAIADFDRLLAAAPDEIVGHMIRAAAARGEPPPDEELIPALTGALTHLVSRRWAVAREKLDRLAAQQPESFLLRNLRGWAAMLANDPATAVADFQAVLQQAPDDPGAYLGLGICLDAGGDPATAQAVYGMAIERGLDGPLVYQLRAGVRFRLGQFGPAEADYEALIQRAPQSGLGYYGRAAARLSRGEARAAEEDYTLALQYGFDGPPAWQERAAARLDLGDVDGAAADLAEAETRGASGPGFLYVRGVLALGREDYDNAVADLTAAIEQGHSAPQSFYFRAVAHLARREHAQAEADFSRAIEAGPASAVAYDGRGQARFGLEQFEAALDDFDQALVLDPGNPAILAYRAATRYLTGHWAGAAADLADVLPHAADDVFLRQVNALCLVRLGRLDESEAEVAWLLATAPDDPTTHECYAGLLLARGEYAAAVEALQDFKTDEALPELQLALGLALLLAGRPEEATAQYEQGVVEADAVTRRIAANDLAYWTAARPERFQDEATQAAVVQAWALLAGD